VVSAVSLPTATVTTAVATFTQPVVTTVINSSDNLVGFQGDFTFDETVVTFQNPPVSSSGLTATNWNVTGNVVPGSGPIRTLRVSAFANDFTPLSGSGVLFNLNMTRVSSTSGANTALTWAASPDDFLFIDGDLNPQTACNTPAGSITIQATVNISGTISYCSDPSIPTVPGVTLNLTGDSSGSTTSDGSGNYSFTVNAGGNYVVTPSMAPRTPASPGINTVDVLAVQLHYLGVNILPSGCRLTAADVNGDTFVDTVDTIAIQRFFLGLSTGIADTGKYKFTPASRSYSSVLTNQTSEGYDALILGDVASSFIHLPERDGTNETNGTNGTVAKVTLPNAMVDSRENNFIAAVTTSLIDRNGWLIGFQGEFTFDERIVTFQDPPVEAAGLTADNWNVSGNVLSELTRGPLKTLRISAYSLDATPLSGSGTLFHLNMTRVSKTAPPTQLLWANPPDFFFIDTDLNTHKPGTAVPGSVRTKQSAPSAAE